MKNKKITMLSVTLWIVIVAVIIGLILFIASGFNLFVGMLILSWIATVLPVFMFGSTTFLLGYGQTSNLSISILLLVICGIATYFVSPLITLSADPKWLYGIIKLLLLFSITLGAGYLARHLPMMGQIATGATTGLLFFYIALAGLSGYAYTSVDSDIFLSCKTDQKKNGMRYYYDCKMFIDPFPARIIGIKQYNDKGEVIGYSRSEKIYTIQHTSMENSEIAAGDSNISLHKEYLRTLRTILAPVKNAIRIDREQHSVLMYYQSDTLYRKEILYFPNGIVNRVSHYYFDETQGSFKEHNQENSNDDYTSYQHVFDPLGYFPEQPWSVHDFHKTSEVVDVVHSIGTSVDALADNTLNQQQQRSFEWMYVIDTLRNNLKTDPFSILCASRFAPTTTISISVDTNSGTDDSDFKKNRFTKLKTVEQMNVVCNALALCRLESGVATYTQFIRCDRIRIQENGTDNHIGLYLFKDGAISADLRFCFIYDPSSHSESKKRADAKRLWDEMIEIVNGYR